MTQRSAIVCMRVFAVFLSVYCLFSSSFLLFVYHIQSSPSSSLTVSSLAQVLFVHHHHHPSRSDLLLPFASLLFLFSLFVHFPASVFLIFSPLCTPAPIFSVSSPHRYCASPAVSICGLTVLYGSLYTVFLLPSSQRPLFLVQSRPVLLTHISSICYLLLCSF